MKYYTLTALKDMPNCESGFNYTISDSKDSDKINCLREYQNFSDFVKIELDLNQADKNFNCPNCNKKSLFPYEEEGNSYSDGSIKEWYNDIGFECGLCSSKFKIISVLKKRKVDW